ncbi:hypothetical protein [Agromyces larvae]|uniref:DUF4254 domain-containing protein n=1 Tax=Agromyces larvae TaxID=2929802 RepID=A0ABY4C9Z2_9MICO|nr:hypothetical protein [Agromyces larvae]UOE45505.1 hypothetical protein MTO99_07035 [Agromyces larvae]
MSQVERLRAAILKLETLRAEITPGPWIAEYSGEQGHCVIPADADSTREAIALTRLYHAAYDAELIVTLHRTIDAQLAILRNRLEVYGEDVTPYGFRESTDRLADAILGGAS